MSARVQRLGRAMSLLRRGELVHLPFVGLGVKRLSPVCAFPPLWACILSNLIRLLGVGAAVCSLLIEHGITRGVRRSTHGAERLTFKSLHLGWVGASATLQLQVLADGIVK